jgi:Ricin-type beta-trefoil lectin domain-like
VLAGPASASSTFDTRLTPLNTFYLVLDVSGASTQPGAPVIDWWINDGANQSSEFVPYGGNRTYEIINDNSGQCLTTDGVAGDQLYQFPRVGRRQQLWETLLTAGAGGSYNIASAYGGLYVDVSGDSAWPGAAVDTWYGNGGHNQYFAEI